MYATFVAFLIAWGGVCNVAVATITPVISQVSASYRWESGYLYYGNGLIGCWNGVKYFAWNGANWVEGPVCPVDNPYLREQRERGVNMEKIKQNQCSVNGKDCSKERGMEAMAKGTLQDDSSKLHLTVYGDGREGVVQDLQKSPLLAEHKDKFLVHNYPANHWAVDPKLNFPEPRDGKPVVLVTDSSGGVIHAQKDYDDGSKGLANALTESLRRPVPHTDPNKFPDLRKGVNVDNIIEWLKSRSPLGVAWWVVIATIAVIYYINRKKPAPPVVVNT